MKKFHLAFVLLFTFSLVKSQTTISRTFEINKIKKLKLDFDYPKLVKLQTWDKNEVLVEAKININEGENNNEFVIKDILVEDVLKIEGYIKDISTLNRRLSLANKNKVVDLRDKNALNALAKNNSCNDNVYTYNLDVDIEIVIYVPRSLATDVTSTYGLIEIKDFAAPIKANSPYRGIDITISEKNVGDLAVKTNYGEIFTNLNFNVIEKESRNFYNYFKANIGSGYNCAITSTYGKLYIRKSEL